jgi:hypothetical protein
MLIREVVSLFSSTKIKDIPPYLVLLITIFISEIELKSLIVCLT